MSQEVKHIVCKPNKDIPWGGHPICNSCLAAYDVSKTEGEKNPMAGYEVMVAYARPKDCSCRELKND